MVRLFSFADLSNAGSARRMKRQVAYVVLGLAILLAAGFAMWGWFRPYDWHADRGARCQVVQVRVSQDRSYYWLEVRLKMNPLMLHDLRKKVVLVTAQPRTLEAADSIFTRADPQIVTDLWFKFWLEPTDLEGPLTLRLNDGTLLVKATNGLPALGYSSSRTFSSNQW